MFKKPDSRPPFSLSGVQIKEDVESVYLSEAERHKLFHCVDERPPHEQRFMRVEQFLRGSRDLEKNCTNIQCLSSDLQAMKSEIADSIRDLKREMETTAKRYA